MRLFVLIFCAAVGPLLAQSGAPLSDALKTFKSGDYAAAIPLLKGPVSKEQEAVTRSALLSSLVYQGSIDEAVDLAEDLESRFPKVPAAITARAELLYYLGEISQAEKMFKAALQLDPENARANLGLHHIFHAASYYRTARNFCLRAYSLDPEDALIKLNFMRYLVPQKLREEYGPFMEAHPWFAKSYQRDSQFNEEVQKELAERKPFELEGPKQETTLHLVDLLSDVNRIRGFGLQVSVDGGKPLRLLVDTGASGIVITQKAADKAGLKHVGSGESWGFGDGGVRKSFAAFSSACSIGTLRFKNCVFDSFEGKGKIAGDEDGLIGTDFFEDYLIHIDFQRHQIKLTPLEPLPRSIQGYDRTVPAGEGDFTPVFRYGHMLMIPTKVNGATSAMFGLDTGSSTSLIDSNFARLSTKVHGDAYTTVRGVSGKVKEVFEADKAELEFGRFRQRNLGILAFNLNNTPRHQEVRLSGILGMPVLVMFRLDLDYRNGLVKFDYILK